VEHGRGVSTLNVFKTATRGSASGGKGQKKMASKRAGGDVVLDPASASGNENRQPQTELGEGACGERTTPRESLDKTAFKGPAQGLRKAKKRASKNKISWKQSRPGVMAKRNYRRPRRKKRQIDLYLEGQQVGEKGMP